MRYRRKSKQYWKLISTNYIAGSCAVSPASLCQTCCRRACVSDTVNVGANGLASSIHVHNVIRKCVTSRWGRMIVFSLASLSISKVSADKRIKIKVDEGILCIPYINKVGILNQRGEDRKKNKIQVYRVLIPQIPIQIKCNILGKPGDKL